jgi:hypothetical protein
LPQPHRGNPGGAAPWLSRPLAVRIAVPPPTQALLTSPEAAQLAEAISTALQAGDVPATATDTPLPLDWRLEIVAESNGRNVRPRYRLLDADGRPQGSVGGTPVGVRAWTEARRETLDGVAADAANRVGQLVLSIQAARAAAPVSALAGGALAGGALAGGALAGGPERLRLLPVTGAPGDGNAALTARLREFLSAQGYVVQDVADGAAFAVTATVSVVPAPNRMERVEIQWIVSRRDGYELGRVLQLNEVPAGRLNRFWGDVAYAAAQEAAGGVRQVIRNAAATPDTASGR